MALALAACGGRRASDDATANAASLAVGAGLRPGSSEDLRIATRALDALRATAPRRAYARQVRARVALGPRGTTEAQGALAVRPGEAVRLVLVGPAGATALDLWARGRTFSLALPAAGRHLAGSLDDPGDDAARTPVRALVTALTDPLAGRVTFVGRRASGAHVVGLTGPGGVVLVEPSADALTLAWPARGEGLVLTPPTLAAPEGGRARFVAPRERVEVDVTIVGVVEDPPDDEVFAAPPSVGAAGAETTP